MDRSRVETASTATDSDSGSVQLVAVPAWVWLAHSRKTTLEPDAASDGTVNPKLPLAVSGRECSERGRGVSTPEVFRYWPTTCREVSWSKGALFAARFTSQ